MTSLKRINYIQYNKRIINKIYMKGFIMLAQPYWFSFRSSLLLCKSGFVAELVVNKTQVYLPRLALFLVVVSIIACTSAPAVAVDGVKPFKYDSNSTETHEEYADLVADKDYSDNEILYAMAHDRLSMPFNPENYYSFPPLPGMTEFYQNTQTAEGAQADANPVIIKVNGENVYATEFTDRMYQRHREWFEVFVKEMFVAEVAKNEAAQEGIRFSEEYVKNANDRIFNLLTTRAAKEGRSFKKVWKDQGFETEKAYRKRWRKYTERMLLLEHLIMLHYFRTNKVEYSHIVLSDKKDSLNPDPEDRAKSLAEKLQQGKITWNTAVKKYSRDHRTIKENGRVGMVLQGTTGLPKIEEFLFSHKPGDISDPIQTIYGYQIIKINKSIPGKKDAKYWELRENIDKELRRVYKEHIPGLRITNQDSFDWLEEMMRQKRCKLQLYYPAHLDKLPAIGRVDDKEITAGEFFVHTFENKPEWARQVVSEIIIFELAKREAVREKIEFTDEKVDELLKNVMKYLESQTQSHKDIIVEESETDKKDKDQLWYKLGYRNADDFSEMIRRLTVEGMQIERLILLHDYKVERIKLYQILCMNEDEANQARAEVIRVRARGEGDFSSVARKISRHKKSRIRGGLIGIVFARYFQQRI